jgi:DNA-binding NtrC family response regulator
MTLTEPEAARILVVDDEPDMVWALTNALESEGWIVNGAASGAEAVDLLVTVDFDVALVDAILPDWDGIDLATLIHHQRPRTAVVLVSGYFYLEDPAITEGMQMGLFEGFVAKPCDLQEVRRVIRQTIERRAEVRCSP